MKKFILIFGLIFALILTGCAKGSGENTSSDGLYEQPDFSERPSPSGKQVLTTIDDMIRLYNSAPYVELPLIKEIDATEQTLYTSKEFKDGVDIEGGLQPLALIGNHLELLDIRELQPLSADKFELNDEKTMAYLKESEMPKSFQGLVPCHVALDLTSGEMVLLAMSTENTTTGNRTYYFKAIISYAPSVESSATLKSKVSISDYGHDNGMDYVFIKEATSWCSLKDTDIHALGYECVQTTATIADVVGEDSEYGMYETTIYAAEKDEITIDIEKDGDNYIINKDTTVYQTDTSSNVKDAEYVYSSTQDMRMWESGYYVLKEVATNVDTEGQQHVSTQYVTFIPKD